MVSLLAATLVVGQTLSESASVLYTGIPALAAPAEARLISHSATGELGKDGYTQDTVTLVKNLTNKPLKVTVVIPVHGQNTTWPMLKDHRLSANLDGTPVTLSKKVETVQPDPGQRANGVVYGGYKANYQSEVTFAPKQTRALRVQYSCPLGRAGLDGLQRLTAYDTSGAKTWMGPVDQFNYSLKYDPKLVFQVFAALPKAWSWQIGPRGAFVKRNSFAPEERPLVIFTYYPGGFEPIGTGGQ